MPGPIMTTKEAEKRYGVKLPYPPKTKVYHRGNLQFSVRDIKLDKSIISGPMRNRIGEKGDPYAQTEDEPRIDKTQKSSSVKAHGIRKDWSTWKHASDRKQILKKLKPIKVKKNKPNAKKPRIEHRRKRGIKRRVR